MFPLDDKKNVKVDDLANSTLYCRAISKFKPIRDIDWVKPRLNHTFLNNTRQAIAAHGQRCGDVMTNEESCVSCKAGCGAFKSCVVLSHEATTSLDFLGGCCMNCYFKARGRFMCSLCKSYLLKIHHVLIRSRSSDRG